MMAKFSANGGRYDWNPEGTYPPSDGPINNAIWLQDWQVDITDTTGEEVEVAATYMFMRKDCPKCGAVDRLYKHGKKEVRYRDTPAFGRKVTLVVQVQRFRCQDCGETCMQPLHDMDKNRQITERLGHYIAAQGVRRTFADVAREVGLDDETVRNICLEDFEDALRHRTYETPIVLGIDEVHVNNIYRAAFTDIGSKELLDILPDMLLPGVEAWLTKLPGRHRVQVVTMDMHGGYRTAVIAALPKAKIVIDKFHVLSVATDALMAVRKKAKEWAENGFGEKPKVTKLLLETSRHKLKPHQDRRLRRLLAKFPIISAGWHAKENFYDIWDTKDRAEAEKRFKYWAENIPELVETEFRPIVGTVKRHHQEIFNYFDYPFTNAYAEARNRIIKDIKRAGRGYSFEVIRAKALLAQKLNRADYVQACEDCLEIRPREEIQAAYRVGADQGKVAARWLCKSCSHTGGKYEREAIPF